MACLPLELKLRGKSTTQSHRAPIFYVDLVVRSGMTLEEAITEARRLDTVRKETGFDQAALDEAARRGFATGAFEELDEDGPSVVEEFFPDEQGMVARPDGAAPKGLSGRLQEKVAIASTG